MIILELREAAYEKAFELLDEAKELDKKKKMVMCELEDAIYECYETSKDEEEYEPSEEHDEDEDKEISFRRGNYRHLSRNMRMRHHDEYEDGNYALARNYRSRVGMRRRNRMGQFA